MIVTVYFWWENIKGISESSEKALRIMKLTTVMVVILIGWCIYTVILRHSSLPPLPVPSNIHLTPSALGWLAHSSLPQMFGIIAIFVGLGHSVLAMSGEESLAQVYREIESPKLPNLKKAGLVIFVYSLVFTSLVSFFAVMIIPDDVRQGFLENLIGGLAMNLAGPFIARLIFHGFVVVVGTLILAGAVNTAIVGSNGVLNRVSEDGVLTDWFRQPHPRFGTSYRIINIVVILQIATIIISRGDVTFLANLYAFGVIWSFAMNGLAVLVLRYTNPGEREFQVPFNLRIRGVQIPIGLSLITLMLFLIAIVNLFTKPVATMAGGAFSILLYIVFTISERRGRNRGVAHVEMDQFNLELEGELSPEAVGARPGNILVPVSNHFNLYHLGNVLDRSNPAAAMSLCCTSACCAAPALAKTNSKPISFSAASSNIFSRKRYRWLKNAANRFASRSSLPTISGTVFCAPRRPCNPARSSSATARKKSPKSRRGKSAKRGKNSATRSRSSTSKFTCPTGTRFTKSLGPRAKPHRQRSSPVASIVAALQRSVGGCGTPPSRRSPLRARRSAKRDRRRPGRRSRGAPPRPSRSKPEQAQAENVDIGKSKAKNARHDRRVFMPAFRKMTI